MKAGVASANGVVVADVPQPRPAPHQVLVKVKAACLNRADLTTARGLPHGPGGGIGQPIGIEWAGEVAEVGAEVRDIKVGQRVMGSGNGGYAEYAVSDWGRTTPMPDGMSFETAATMSGKYRASGWPAFDCRKILLPSRKARQRKPSHFGSYCQSSPIGMSSTERVSIGGNGGFIGSGI